MEKMKIVFKENWFIILILFFALIKQIMVSCIPIFGITNGVHDDLMMVNMGYSLLHGDWLGTYSQYTLVKGMFFPFFLAVSNFVGISYINSANLFYTFSCIFFIYSIKPFWNEKKDKKVLFLIYLVLLFNPVSYAQWTLQRLYRNGMTLSQVLIIFGVYFNAYLRIKENKIGIINLILGGIILASFVNTREDAIWLYPFVLIITIVLIIKRIKIKKLSLSAFSYVIPILILILTNIGISLINYNYYGIFTTNELNAKPFKSIMQSIYKIDDENITDKVAAPRSKINRLYEMSPTINSIKDELEISLDKWSKMDMNPNDNEVENGWFFWSLRDAVSMAGYYQNATMAADFYTKASSEIEEYIKNNNVETIAVMPSSLMAPYQSSYFSQIINAILKISKYLVTFQEVETISSASVDDEKIGIEQFEALANTIAYDSKVNAYINGYIYSKNEDKLKLELYDTNDNFIHGIDLKNEAGQVIDDTNKSLDKYFINEKFEINTSSLYIKIINLTTNKEYIVNFSDPNSGNLDNNIVYNFNEKFANSKYDDIYLLTKRYERRLNLIGKIYKLINPIVFLISVLLYIFMTIKIIINRKNYQLLQIWLINLSIILSLFVLILGVSYNEVSSCFSIRYMYLSGAYPLLLMFEFLTIGYIIKVKLLGRKKKYEK
mgnify:CR=1 FL=1